MQRLLPPYHKPLSKDHVSLNANSKKFHELQQKHPLCKHTK
jgi:hypothetical protein